MSLALAPGAANARPSAQLRALLCQDARLYGLLATLLARMYSMDRPRKRALLIGINYRGQAAELAGCVNDIVDVRAVCTALLYDEVCVLYDGAWPGTFSAADNRLAGTRPTRANITAAFRWLVAGAGRGDKLYLHYSGHGGQLPSRGSGEADGCDETLVPVDYETAGMMRDDEIRALLIEPLRGTGATLRGVLDCCHSGTGMDLKYNLSLAVDAPARRGVAAGGASDAASGAAGDDIRAIVSRLTAVAIRDELVRWFGEAAVAATFTGLAAAPVPVAAAAAAVAAASPDAVFIERAEGAPATALSAAAIGARGVAGQAAPPQAPDVIIVSGCADSQTSADASFNHRANGALTYYVLAVLRRSISGGAWPPAPDFLLELRRRLRAGGYEQIPQISSESPVSKATLFNLI